ncbi:unnamed protein product, partial [Didymodactylos carnosus]
KAHLRTS